MAQREKGSRRQAAEADGSCERNEQKDDDADHGRTVTEHRDGSNGQMTQPSGIATRDPQTGTDEWLQGSYGTQGFGKGEGAFVQGLADNGALTPDAGEANEVLNA